MRIIIIIIKAHWMQSSASPARSGANRPRLGARAGVCVCVGGGRDREEAWECREEGTEEGEGGRGQELHAGP